MFANFTWNSQTIRQTLINISEMHSFSAIIILDILNLISQFCWYVKNFQFKCRKFVFQLQQYNNWRDTRISSKALLLFFLSCGACNMLFRLSKWRLHFAENAPLWFFCSHSAKWSKHWENQLMTDNYVFVLLCVP